MTDRTETAPAPVSTTTVEAPAKPRRGRPPGSKNTAKATSTQKPKFGDMTVAQLEREVAKRKRQVESFQNQRRKALIRELTAADKSLASLGGTSTKVAKPSTKKVGRPKGSTNGKKITLASAMIKFMKRRTKGMKVKQIQEALIKAEYPTKSKNLYPLIAQTLRNTDLFVNVSRGLYTVKVEK